MAAGLPKKCDLHVHSSLGEHFILLGGISMSKNELIASELTIAFVHKLSKQTKLTYQQVEKNYSNEVSKFYHDMLHILENEKSFDIIS